jgi:hypothetical protein
LDYHAEQNTGIIKGAKAWPFKDLTGDAVYHSCDTSKFFFQTTEELEPLEELSEALAQPRAVESLALWYRHEAPGV